MFWKRSSIKRLYSVISCKLSRMRHMRRPKRFPISYFTCGKSRELKFFYHTRTISSDKRSTNLHQLPLTLLQSWNSHFPRANPGHRNIRRSWHNWASNGRMSFRHIYVPGSSIITSSSQWSRNRRHPITRILMAASLPCLRCPQKVTTATLLLTPIVQLNRCVLSVLMVLRTIYHMLQLDRRRSLRILRLHLRRDSVCRPLPQRHSMDQLGMKAAMRTNTLVLRGT